MSSHTKSKRMEKNSVSSPQKWGNCPIASKKISYKFISACLQMPTCSDRITQEGKTQFTMCLFQEKKKAEGEDFFSHFQFLRAFFVGGICSRGALGSCLSNPCVRVGAGCKRSLPMKDYCSKMRKIEMRKLLVGQRRTKTKFS